MKAMRYQAWIAALIALAAVCLPASAATQPTISKKEAELLKTVEGIAVTNVNRAIAVLQAEDAAKRSPALDFALCNFLLQSEKLDRAANAYRLALKKMPQTALSRAIW